MIPTKSLIRTVSYTMSSIWSVAVAINGFHLSSTTSKILGLIPAILVGAFTMWDLWLWRVKPLTFLELRPDLGGTWLGHFDSEWFDQAQKLNETTSPVALVIKQSFTSVSITLLAEKSKSYSVLSTIRKLESGEHRINYQYANTPLVKFRQEMPAHSGSTELTIASARADQMSGEYWTNRLSHGETYPSASKPCPCVRSS